MKKILLNVCEVFIVVYIMAILTIEVLKNLIENIPDDYTVEYNKEVTIAPITDRIEIDISGKRLIFK